MERDVLLLEAAALIIDVMTAYILFKRVTTRYAALRGRG